MKKVTTIFVIAALFVLASSGTAFATIISKPYEFGPGLQFTTSVLMSFSVPCGRQVNSNIKFKRLGPAGASNDVPILIEFRQPDTSPNVEGPLVQSKNVNATTTEQTVTILSAAGGSTRGCSLPWRIRVRHANSGPSPFPVFGTSRVEFDGTQVQIPLTPFGSLLKGASKTVNFGDTSGFKQGRISAHFYWVHEIFGAPVGLNYIKLKFELLDPSGNLVQTSEGYSFSSPLSPKAFLKFLVPTCTSGQWRLRITNLNANDDVKLNDPINSFLPTCTLPQ